MPSISRRQQRIFCMALAYKAGKLVDSSVTFRAKELANSMTEEQLRHYTVYDPDYKKE